MLEKVRLAKFIAHAGVCSRKQAARLIDQGEVTVNGRAANHIDHVDEHDDVIVLGEKISAKALSVTSVLTLV